MPDASARDPVRTTPPPLWLVHGVANPLMRLVIPSRLGRWLPGIAVLRFTGRQTGRAYTVPTGIYDHDGVQVVFTESPWMVNFRGGTSVEVVRRGRTSLGHGRLVTDPGFVGPAIRAVIDAGTSLTMLGIAIDKGHHPTDDELAAVRSAIVIRDG